MSFAKAIMTVLFTVAAVSAATPERLREELAKALPLAEAGEVAEAMEVVREIGGCDTAPDRRDFEPVPYVGSEAAGIRKALELIDGGRYALADGLARAMTGCYSGILDAVMRNSEKRSKAAPGPEEGAKHRERVPR